MRLFGIYDLKILSEILFEDFEFMLFRKDWCFLGKEKEVEVEGKRYYVNVFKFSSLVQSLVNFLNLTNGYTLVLLNPKSPVNRKNGQMYGYRVGFSKGEIEMLRGVRLQFFEGLIYFFFFFW